MKVKKKAVVVDAFQWTGGPDQIEDPEWIVKAIIEERVRIRNTGLIMKIQTSFGTLTAYPGDWLVKDARGGIFPYDDATFKETYEVVEE